MGSTPVNQREYMELIMVVLAALVGSIFTIVVQILFHSTRKNRIRKAVNSILTDIILPSLSKIENEIPNVQKTLGDLNAPDLVLGVHPALNANYLKSFSLEDLRSVYNNKLHHIIDSMAILDHLEKHTPFIILDQWVNYCSLHIENHFEGHKNRWNTEEEHFMHCPVIITERERYAKNLTLLLKPIEELRKNINILIQ